MLLLEIIFLIFSFLPFMVSYQLRFIHMFEPFWELLFGFLPPVIFLILFICMIGHRYSFSWMESINFVGFKEFNYPQLFAGSLCLVPMFICYFLSYKLCIARGYSPSLQPTWQFQIFFIFLMAVNEESIFRGFFFRCLRQNRSFLTAASFSGLLSAIQHSGHFISSFISGDPSSYNPTVVFSWIGLAFFSSFPSAFIFERGGNVIWGWLLVHFGLDVVSIVGFQTPKGYFEGFPTYFSWLGIILSGVIAFPIGYWLLPKNFRKRKIKKGQYIN